MMWFLLGFVIGAVVALLLPPEKTAGIRDWLANQWKKLTKKG